MIKDEPNRSFKRLIRGHRMPECWLITGNLVENVVLKTNWGSSINLLNGLWA